MKMRFTDKVVFDKQNRTAIACRDGYQDYLVAELIPTMQEFLAKEMGLSTHDIVKLYRSPETIKKASEKMIGIPLTNEHVDQGSTFTSIGKVLSAENIELKDEKTNTTIATKVKMDLADALDKNELSLGYEATTIVSADADGVKHLEQIDILPHHLAIVEKARCGSACSFLDSNPIQNKEQELKKFKFKFKDEDVSLSLQEMADLIATLPEALKEVPTEELQKYLPTFKEIVDIFRAKGAPLVVVKKGEDENEDSPENPMTPEEKKEKMQDSAIFKDALKAKVGEYVSVFQKAKDFLPANYSFVDKLPCDIMRDALKTEYKDTKFKDEELGVAFKMLKKKSEDYGTFADNQTDKFADFRNKKA